MTVDELKAIALMTDSNVYWCSYCDLTKLQGEDCKCDQSNSDGSLWVYFDTIFTKRGGKWICED